MEHHLAAARSRDAAHDYDTTGSRKVDVWMKVFTRGLFPVAVAGFLAFYVLLPVVGDYRDFTKAAIQAQGQQTKDIESIKDAIYQTRDGINELIRVVKERLP